MPTIQKSADTSTSLNLGSIPAAQGAQLKLLARWERIKNLEIHYFGDPDDFKMPSRWRSQGEAISDSEILIAAQTDRGLSENSEGRNLDFLERILRIPPTSRETEKALFREMNYLKYRAVKERQRCLGDYAHSSDINPNTIDIIEKCLSEANEIRDEIVLRFLGRSASFAKKKMGWLNLLEERVSAASEVLVNSVDFFDYSRGFKFITYVCNGIEKEATRSFESKSRSSNWHLKGDFNDQIDQDRFHILRDRDLETLVREVKEMLDNSKLSKREIRILNRRYGLNGEEPRSLEGTADGESVKLKRVQQIQAIALEKLRKRVRRNPLHDLLSFV